jgi:hypothetical protein
MQLTGPNAREQEGKVNRSEKSGNKVRKERTFVIVEGLDDVSRRRIYAHLAIVKSSSKLIFRGLKRGREIQ